MFYLKAFVLLNKTIIVVMFHIFMEGKA